MKPIVLLKRVIFAAALIPAAMLLVDAFTGRLTANPIDFITDTTGDWAIRFVIITLCVTPIRRITGWNPIIRLRRMLGLFAFFYATLHVLTYVVLDYFFRFDLMWENLLKARYITAGTVSRLSQTSPQSCTDVSCSHQLVLL